MHLLIVGCCVALLFVRPALSSSSCPTPVCPGSRRQVVAVCAVNDTFGIQSTLWQGTSIVNCGTRDFLALTHLDNDATDSCAGTTFTASTVSVEGTVYTSELSMIPTSSNNGETVGCYTPGLNDLVHQCTLNVPTVDVSGLLEQQGLSGVTVTVSLPDRSGGDCVDEYFAVLNGDRTNTTSTRIGPFSEDLCATPDIYGVIVGTIRNGVDGPTATASSLQANTRNLYSNLAASHAFDESGVTFDFSWTVVDSTVMTQSDVSCSCSPDTVSSTSATSGRIQVSYGQFPDNQPSPQVNLSVSYQNGACSDTESITYNVSNFGAATVSSSDSQIVTFSFNEELLAPGVTVATIRGSCEGGCQDISLNYPPENPYNLTSTCETGVFKFEVLNSEGKRIGFSFSIAVNSPTSPVPEGIVGLSIGAAVALTFILTFVLTLVVGVSIGVLSVLAVNRCRRSERTSENETEMRPPPVIYEEPEDIKPEPQTQGNMAYGHVQLDSESI